LASAPEEDFRLIRTVAQLKTTLFHIVEEANECLVTTGSRSRDLYYLTAIEAKLSRQPDLVHCSRRCSPRSTMGGWISGSGGRRCGAPHTGVTGQRL
jgi:hypothetical protein